MVLPGIASQDGRKLGVFCPFLFAFLLFVLPAAQQLAVAAPSAGTYLLLEDMAGKILFAVPLEEQEEFAIRYRHSVALTPVTDYFRIKNGEIWLDRTVYQDFGAGLPHAPESGQHMSQRHGELVIGGYNRRLPTFQLRVGRIAAHTLLLFGAGAGPDAMVRQEIPLDSLSVPGSAIMFSTSRQLPDAE